MFFKLFTARTKITLFVLALNLRILRLSGSERPQFSTCAPFKIAGRIASKFYELLYIHNYYNHNFSRCQTQTGKHKMYY